MYSIGVVVTNVLKEVANQFAQSSMVTKWRRTVNETCC